jgi:glycosyltransferase involved in cell wall biosynthesis
VRPGKHGWLVDVGNEGEFAKKILFAASRRKDLVKMGKAARIVAEKKANWDHNQKSLIRAYQMAQNGTN